MLSIEQCLEMLDSQFAFQHDIRMVPSILLGIGYQFRVTISNLPNWMEKHDYSARANSYQEAFNIVLTEIQTEIISNLE